MENPNDFENLEHSGDKNLHNISDEEKKKMISKIENEMKKIRVKVMKSEPDPLAYSDYIELGMTLALLYAEFPDRYVDSLTIFSELSNLAEKKGDIFYLANIKGAMASIFYAKKRFREALDYYTQSINLLNRTGMMDIKAEIMIGKKGMGLCQLALNRTESGVDNLLEAANLCAEINDINTYMEIITILKLFFEQNQDWEIIIELENKAIEVLKQTNSIEEIAYAYLEIGVAQSKLKRFEDALISFKKSVNNAMDFGDTSLIYRGVVLVGETYFHLRKIEEAKKEYIKALQLAAYMGMDDEIEKTKMVLLALGTDNDTIKKAIEVGEKEKRRVKT